MKKGGHEARLFPYLLSGEEVPIFLGLLELLGKSGGKAFVLRSENSLSLFGAGFDTPEAGNALIGIHRDAILVNGPHGTLLDAQTAVHTGLLGLGDEAPPPCRPPDRDGCLGE